MGFLRLLLALSVVIDHQSEGAMKFGPGGEISVQCFYAISGYYIAMVLDRTYRSNALFWANRGLRLLPSYWVVAAVTLIILPANLPDIWARFMSLPIFARAFVVFSNFSLIGQDWPLFFGFNHGHLSLVKYFGDSDFPLYKLLVDPPAWSLGIELGFYALAPFILRKGWTVLLGCLVGSLVLRVALAVAGLRDDPWSYRFFPSELATFLAGSVAYRIYRMYQSKLTGRPWLGRTVTLLILAVIACVGSVRLGGRQQQLLSVAVVASGLPFLAAASRSSRIDRFVGNLSYPIYICHWMVMRLVNEYATLPNLASKVAVTVAGVVIVGLLLQLCVDEPIERLRAVIRDRSMEARLPVPGALPDLGVQT
jgi:peptidoglycan/LPS O-acetylase OafA/YrhL